MLVLHTAHDFVRLSRQRGLEKIDNKAIKVNAHSWGGGVIGVLNVGLVVDHITIRQAIV